MDITPKLAESIQLVQKYGASGFTVNGQNFAYSVLVFREKTLPWSVVAFSELTMASFDALFSESEMPEILLIGCGAKQGFLNPSIRKALKEKGIIADVMDTGAACRTFNVLIAEERKVAAALIKL